MSGSMFSSSWYRLANLRPGLRGHININRHHYRGRLWYVLHDNSNGKNHRFTPQVHYVLTLMNGKRNFDKIWELALDYLGDDAPTQDEMVQLFGQLHSNDLLLCDITPDTLEIFQRYEKKEKSKLKQKLWAPLAIRIPVWDPDDFLEKWLPWVAPFFSWGGRLLWILVIGFAAFLAIFHWTDLSGNITDKVLSPGNLLVLFFIYPVVKFCHEMGHAFSTKIWGGEVHEMGVMFLVFMPIPYVDASSSWTFRNKKKRLWVGAAGMAVELFLASLALFVWLNVEDGLVSAICYNTMLIGGVSTLFFNGNPLLRFDGYYILSDLIEIPNLASRANNYVGYLIQRYLFAVHSATSPANTPGECAWFVSYSLAAFCYRMFISFFIIFFVAGQFFFVGVLLAIWAMFTMLVVPLFKQFKFLFTSPAIQRKRFRAVVSSFIILSVLMSFLLLYPMPLSTYAQGVLWLPEQSRVKAGSEGFIQKIYLDEMSQVKKGDVILKMNDPLLYSQEKLLNYRSNELEVRLKQAQFEDPVEAKIILDQLYSVTQEQEQLQNRIDALSIRSPIDGTLIIPQLNDLPGRFFRKGELVAYVVSYPITIVRAVVTQDDIGLVRGKMVDVEVRLAEQLSKRYKADILREIPAASDQLPSAALGFNGGGVIPVSPTDSSGETAFETVFQLELKLSELVHAKHLGGRVYIRFDHGDEPFAMQIFRSTRQLFLRQFSL